MDYQKIIRYLAVSIVILAYSLLFPQTAFRDCLRVVFTQHVSENPEKPFLTERDYLDLFHLDKSDYQVAWKFF